MLLRSLNLKPDAPHAARVRRLTIIAALTFVAIFGLFALYAVFGKPILELMKMGKGGMPVTTVSAQAAEARPWQQTLSAVGSVVAVQGADLAAEVDSTVREVKFTSGQDVAAGDILVRLDDEILGAQLRARQADADNAEREFQRSAKLTAQGHVSQSALDAARSRRDQAVAAVAQAQALVDQKLIKAPFAGRTGVRRVAVGQFVRQGDVIVTLQTLKPIYVNFDLPEQALSQASVGQAVVVTSDTYPGEKFAGKLTSFDPSISPTTRTFLAQATLGNEDGKLAPGMFSRVTLAVGAPAQVVTVPEIAVTYSLSGDSVFVVSPPPPPPEKRTPATFWGRMWVKIAASFASDTSAPAPAKPQPVEQRIVKLGESRDGFVAILSGLKVGEIVVTTGQLKLYPGATAVIDNSVLPKSSAETAKY